MINAFNATCPGFRIEYLIKKSDARNNLILHSKRKYFNVVIDVNANLKC